MRTAGCHNSAALEEYVSKKHFIALEDAIRRFNQLKEEGCETANHFDAQQLGVLADFCRGQNPNFDRDRWLDYIAGRCGPSGGAVK